MGIFLIFFVGVFGGNFGRYLGLFWCFFAETVSCSDFGEHFGRTLWSPRRTSRTPNKTLLITKGEAEQDPTRPRPARGRADCLRFALPAEAIGGLDAWMLGGLEGQGLGET